MPSLTRRACTTVPACTIFSVWITIVFQPSQTEIIMSEIALYDTLRKIPDVSDTEAREAVAHIASSQEVATKSDIKDMATKADIKDMATKANIAEVKTEIAELETRLVKQMYGAVAIILAGVGLMIRFL